jgi:RNA polymerase sigma factor (sigma-70 family)
MVKRHGPGLLRVANQFSLCHDDALDAYQRALEIYLRRLETVDPATEGAWLRVVVKHEAMAIRRGRQESVEHEDVDLDANVHTGLREVEDAVAGGERVDRSVEALRALKPDEARALLLKAEGMSYDEIGRRFGWTYTKVNRSITEGRKRFLTVFQDIESGEACERHGAALSALAAGTATSAEVVSIRPHLRHCTACRAAVRDMRVSRTRRIALLLPFGWLARPRGWFARAASSDVSTNVQYAASTGGGRLGPAATLIGLCLSGVGAGAACMVTGALPPPPLIARAVESKPAPHKAHHTSSRRAPAPREPTRRVDPPVNARVYAAPATAPPRRVKKKSPPAKTSVRHSTALAKGSSGEFGFEGNASPGAGAASSPTASAASAGGGTSGSGSGSGGGGGAPAKGPSGSEFGFEGGG